MPKRAFLTLSLLVAVLPCLAQKRPIDVYVADIDLAINGKGDYTTVATQDPGKRKAEDLKKILPGQEAEHFADYVAAKTSAVDIFSLIQAVDSLRMDKQVGSSAGQTGVTSLVSNPVAPALIGLGVEYGSILQSTTGSTTTLRANLLGASRMLLGREQFPYCPIINQAKCGPVSRWLRRFSGSTSFESVTNATTAGTATPVSTTTPTAVNLFGNGFRMASWGVRFDVGANDPSDAGFVGRFQKQMQTLRGSKAPADLTKAVADLFGGATDDPTYDAWAEETIPILQKATKGEFKQTLEQRLDLLIDRMMAANENFVSHVVALRRASLNYFEERDTLLQQIQSHQYSLEYTNLHALNQPTTSNVRFIFSHQPTPTPLLITANVALTWYNSLPSGVTTGRLRDVQAAAKLDRRLGVIPNLGNAVLTVGGYYQWMKEDALIEIGPGNVAPGSGIVLPGTAATLLGTKGNIGIVQGRLTVPLNNTIKVPLSLTWSNRTELIKESDTRGQVGVTMDLDSLFR